MKVLVINCGSSSVKYQLIETSDGFVLAKGLVERIGFDNAVFSHKPCRGESRKSTLPVKDHTVAIAYVLEALTGENGVVSSLDEIGAVGHRFVNGGIDFQETVVADDAVLTGIRKILNLAPLHNPAHLLGIEAAIAAMPDTPQVIVFDTGFHARMKPHAYQYALPYEYYENYGIRRYGFHGTSHYYVSHRAAELAGRPLEDMRIITCHLGNGCSIDAVKDGWAVDTSMGFTPLEGLMMGTRTGDIDPAAVLYIMKKEGIDAESMDTLLNKKSGLLGFTGISPDMREIMAAAQSGDTRAATAIDMYCYRIKKYIGAYTGILGGLDALVFTAGVGEHSPVIRAKSVEGLGFLGVGVDPAKNAAAIGGEHDISTDSASVTTFVIPTNEEIVIAREAERVLS